MKSRRRVVIVIFAVLVTAALVVWLVVGLRSSPPEPKPQPKIADSRPAREKPAPRQRPPAPRGDTTPAAKGTMPETPEEAINQYVGVIMETCAEVHRDCFKMDENEAHNYCHLVYPTQARLKDPCDIFGVTMFLQCVKQTIDCDTYNFHKKNKPDDDPYRVCQTQVHSAFMEQCKAAMAQNPDAMPFMPFGKMPRD
ncbi:MAG: hypothetical protein P9L99_10680 [Candidatus Lernaella stagnicola]|nr:hypothetical protein [Candidatus Lernaella stagnicola]